MEGAEDSWTIPKNVINTYCYVLTTFTLPKHWNSKIGYEAAHMGVGAYNPAKDEVTYKAYYQWVPFVLFLQVYTFSSSKSTAAPILRREPEPSPMALENAFSPAGCYSP